MFHELMWNGRILKFVKLGIKMNDRKIKKSWEKFLKRCTERGLKCEFDYDHFVKLKQIRRCYYTGLFLSKSNILDPMHSTLEKIDRKKGYTVDNTVVCASLLSRIKGGFEDLKRNFPKDKILLLSKKLFFKYLRKIKSNDQTFTTAI